MSGREFGSDHHDEWGGRTPRQPRASSWDPHPRTDKEYWSRGYGTDIVKTLLQHLFFDIGLGRVYLHTLAWNYRAQAAFSKAGFTEVRSVRRGGQDILLMEVTKTEWARDFENELHVDGYCKES